MYLYTYICIYIYVYSIYTFICPRTDICTGYPLFCSLRGGLPAFDRKVEWQDWSRPWCCRGLMNLTYRRSPKLWVWDANRHSSRTLSRLVSRGKAGHWDTDKSGNGLLVLFTSNATCAAFLRCPSWWKKLLDVFDLRINGWALLGAWRKRILALSRSLTIETEGKSEMSLKRIVQSEP